MDRYDSDEFFNIMQLNLTVLFSQDSSLLES